MPKQKRDTIVFKQTVSNIAFKRLFKMSVDKGCTIQDLIRLFIDEKTQNIEVKEGPYYAQ